MTQLATHNRNGVAYPTTPRDNGSTLVVDYPPSEISIPLFEDAWGFTYSIVDVANRGDNEKYPATLLISRMPPLYLRDMGHRFFALTFDEYLKINGDIGQYHFGLPADHVNQHALYPVRVSYQGILYENLVGSIWQHHSNVFYRITHVANVETGLKELVPTFFYRNVTTGELYAGPKADWDRRMDYVADGIAERAPLVDEPRIEPARAFIEGRAGGSTVFAFPPTLVIVDGGRNITKPVAMEHLATLQQVLVQVIANKCPSQA